MEEIRKIKLFIDKRPDGIKQPNGSFATINNKDWFIDIFLIKDTKLVHEYIDISTDPTREVLERQLINPFFAELGFFETISKIEEGGDANSNKSDNSLKGKAITYNITINS